MVIYLKNQVASQYQLKHLGTKGFHRLRLAKNMIQDMTWLKNLSHSAPYQKVFANKICHNWLSSPIITLQRLKRSSSAFIIAAICTLAISHLYISTTNLMICAWFEKIRITTFKLLFETWINMPSVVKILACHRQICFYELRSIFLHFAM